MTDTCATPPVAKEKAAIPCATFSTEEAADYTGFGLDHMKGLVATNAIPHLHTGAQGGRIRIPIRALDDWMYERAMSNIERKTS